MGKKVVASIHSLAASRIGKIDEYGMHDIYNMTADSELKVWVEEYMMDWDEAIEKYYDEC